MAPLIRVVGSLNLDFTTVCKKFPAAGETILAESLSINAGGKGANQAVACGRAAFISETEQDVKVEMIGAVGADSTYYKTLLKPMLEDSGVSCAGIHEVEDAETGTATIIVDEGSGGENRILVVPGANQDGMSNIDEVLERTFRKPLPEVIVLQGEIPRATILAILEHNQGLRKVQPLVVLNPAPVFPEGIPLKLLARPVLLIVNETELTQLASTTAGLSLSAELSEVTDRAALDIVAKDFHKAGVRNLIVTLGSRGVYSSCDNDEEKIWESILVPGVRVDRVMDTTAAGDTFVGFFTAVLARWCVEPDDRPDFDLKSAIFRANQAAALCVQRSGAMRSIPYDYEVTTNNMVDDEACGYTQVTGKGEKDHLN